MELLKCREPIRTKELLAITDRDAGGNATRSATLKSLVLWCLHKEAKVALRLLFMVNRLVLMLLAGREHASC